VRRSAAVLAAATCALSCYVVSTHPIRGESPIQLDPALAGSWRGQDELEAGDREDVVTFTSHGDHYVLAGDDEDEVYEITTARLGEHRYLNAIEIGAESSVYFVFRYRVEGDRLWIAPLDRDAVERHRERGELAAEKSEPARPIVLTAGTEELERFLLSHDPLELFPEPNSYSVHVGAE